MPRGIREVSRSDHYHVMVRGNNKEWVFKNSGDRQRILDIIEEKIIDMGNIQLLAYCIMDNHFHLLVKAKIRELSTLMKRVNTSFALYYNEKHGHTGHVFQGRYKTEKIESESSFFGVLRYIHNNPLKVGSVRRSENYKWSSMSSYIEGNSDLLSSEAFKVINAYFDSPKSFISFHKDFDVQLYMDTDKELKIMKEEIVQVLFHKELEKRGLTKEEDIFTDEKLLTTVLLDIQKQVPLSIREEAECLGIKCSLVGKLIRRGLSDYEQIKEA